MDIDILQEQHRWRLELKSVRDIVRQVEEKVTTDNYHYTGIMAFYRIRICFKFSNCEAWKTHLDYQIYKALNHRYQIGLEALNQHLPDFRIDIVYR